MRNVVAFFGKTVSEKDFKSLWEINYASERGRTVRIRIRCGCANDYFEVERPNSRFVQRRPVEQCMIQFKSNLKPREGRVVYN